MHPTHFSPPLVPVSVREKNDFDSPIAISYIVADLGTRHEDPGDRLDAIVDSTRAGKEMLSELSNREASLYATLIQTPLFVSSMMGVADWFPPVSTVISNIPGPREQLYWNGAPLLGSYPISAVFHGFALNITFISYNGDLDCILIREGLFLVFYHPRHEDVGLPLGVLDSDRFLLFCPPLARSL